MSNSHEHSTTISQTSKQRARAPQPQDQQRREAYQPDRGYDDDHGRGVAAFAQQRRQQAVADGREQDHGEDRSDDRDDAGRDRPAHRPLDQRASVVVALQRVTEHEQGESAVPDHVEPDGGLRTAAEQAGRRKQARKGHGVGESRGGGEQIAARQEQQGPGPQDRELRIKQDRGDQVVGRERGLVARDERRHRRERRAGKWYRTCEQDRRDADDR